MEGEKKMQWWLKVKRKEAIVYLSIQRVVPMATAIRSFNFLKWECISTRLLNRVCLRRPKRSLCPRRICSWLEHDKDNIRPLAWFHGCFFRRSAASQVLDIYIINCPGE